MSDEPSPDDYKRFAEAAALQTLRGLLPPEGIEIVQCPELKAELAAYANAGMKLRLAIEAFNGHPLRLEAIGSAGAVYCDAIVALCKAGDVELARDELKSGAAKH
jgi:hypothetical protein